MRGGGEGERDWWQKEPTTLIKFILINHNKNAHNVILEFFIYNAVFFKKNPVLF